MVVHVSGVVVHVSGVVVHFSGVVVHFSGGGNLLFAVLLENTKNNPAINRNPRCGRRRLCGRPRLLSVLFFDLRTCSAAAC